MVNAIRSTLNTALRVPFLRNILLLTLFSVALVPLYGLFVSHPQYEQLLVRITEDEAALSAIADWGVAEDWSDWSNETR